MRPVCAQRQQCDCHVWQSQKLLVVISWQLLPAFPYGLERHYTCAPLNRIKGLQHSQLTVIYAVTNVNIAAKEAT